MPVDSSSQAQQDPEQSKFLLKLLFEPLHNTVDRIGLNDTEKFGAETTMLTFSVAIWMRFPLIANHMLPYMLSISFWILLACVFVALVASSMF